LPSACPNSGRNRKLSRLAFASAYNGMSSRHFPQALAAYPQDGETIEALLETADASCMG